MALHTTTRPDDPSQGMTPLVCPVCHGVVPADSQGRMTPHGRNEHGLAVPCEGAAPDATPTSAPQRGLLPPPDRATRHPLLCETQTQIVQVVLKLTERDAHDLYNDIYRLDRDVPSAARDYPLIHSVYDALDQAGIDGTR